MSSPEHATDLPASENEADIEALAPGTKLLGGQYSIVRYLSSGGFGITYLAEDSLNREVVIKECFPEALCSRRANKSVAARSSTHSGEFQSLVDMFVREARNVAKLRHPSIVGVHQVFEDNHTAYMALDRIQGRDLLDMMETDADRLPPETVVALMRNLLDAIGTVHAQDMLHRDISPDNILMEETGRAVLIDFGAAREEASKKSRAISALLVVKDGYSPQEFYISGSQQGPSSDLYSLAATFYHLMSGHPPAHSQARLAALARNQQDPYLPILGRVDGYDDAFLAAIDKAMNVFPDDRIQSAADWIEMIDPNSARSPFSHAEKAIEIRDIVAKLVDDVAKTIDDDDADAIKAKKSSSPVAVVAAADAPPKKRLTLMEEGELWPIEIAALKKPVPKMPDMPTVVPNANRGVSRLRLATSISLAAIMFSILQSPENNIATQAAPEIRNLIKLGTGLTNELDQWIMASL